MCVLTGPVVVWGQTFTVVRAFPASSPPGWYCRLLSAGGALYGLSSGNSGAGAVFRINADGLGYTNLKSFAATHDDGSGAYTNSDGAIPLGGVILDGDTLDGTAQAGGLYGMGTVYSLKTNGTGFTVLRHLSASDGKAPYAELVVVGGVLYGTTAGGGDFNKGTGPGPIMLSGDRLYGIAKSGGSAGAGTLVALNIAPRIQLEDNSSGMRTNGFGFSVVGYSNQILPVECCTGLPVASWLPLETNTLGAGPVHFVDLNWTNYPQRFYRARAQ